MGNSTQKLILCTWKNNNIGCIIIAATPEEDFYLPNFSIEAIPALQGPDNDLCFSVPVTQDEFIEKEECFEVAITVSAYLMVKIDDGKDTAMVCIQDDNSKF